ncbi:hypothetical protein [Micromonospora sp. LHW51205]|uniref:hypothetical protein n=1 Tax=Micromonospora sp. LHW51205 TaxID=2248752 RepID=UPI0011BDD861|nr:hypothetical protein [Micromonospora sp. LHW51205]
MAAYLRLETAAAGIHLHELPDGHSDEDLAALRARYGIPNDWQDHPDRGQPTTRLPGGGYAPPSGQGWDVSLIDGPLHPSLLAIATVHALAHDPEDAFPEENRR